MKFKLNLHSSKYAKMFILFISLINFKSASLIAEEAYLNETSIDSSTKFETSSSELPTNPFEIVEMIRRANSLNDATNPSEDIDDALKLFNSIEEEKL